MSPPIVLFGAFDRHNFGDLLLAHLAAAQLPGRELVYASLAERDLRPVGGHQVHALHRLAADGRLRGARLLHVGGEILGCSARLAAAMLLPPDEAGATLAYIERHPAEEPPWLQAMLGTDAPMPYVAAREQLPGIAQVAFHAVGGVALGALPPAWRQAVLARLAAADAVSVRDATTFAQLRAAGIAATLVPDPAVMTEALFGPRIRARATQAPVAALREAFPAGYLALQLAAEFGDDAMLDLVAAQLRSAVVGTGLGIVLFRAGAAPLHDDLAMLARLAERLPPAAARLFESLDLWDICALIAGARVQAGSSLHGHLVAQAFGVPAVAMPKPRDPAQGGKLAAWVATWEAKEDALLRPADRLAEGLHRALRAEPARLRAQADRWVSCHGAGFAQVLRGLDEGEG